MDTWLVGTVRALQENMQDVQGRLQSLESVNDPPKQVSPDQSPGQAWGRTLTVFIKTL